MPARPPLLSIVKSWAGATSTSAVVAQNLAVGVVYALLAELVLVPELVGGMRATPVWPADGFALASAWLLGRRVLPGVAAGSALVAAQVAPLAIAPVALAPVVEALVAMRVLRALGFDERLERTRDPLLLTLVAAPAGAVASASVGGVAWALLGPSTAGLAWTWALWAMRAWLGIATTAPLVFAPLRAREIPLTGTRRIEALALAGAFAAAAACVIGLWLRPGVDPPLGFLALPFVTWAGLRFGSRGASLMVALVTVLAIGTAVAGLGPASYLPLGAAQVGTFLFLLVAAVTGQLLGAMKAERDDAMKKRVHLEGLLRHAQKMESVGRLAGGIAHDFNNLLTAILGYTDIVLAGLAPTDPRRADAEEIERAATRAVELTRQMLSFSRRDPHQPRVIDLNRVLIKVEPMLRRVIGEDVTLVVSPKAARPLVRADAGQMEQVIMNLAVNARDAMPGGGRLTVETRDLVVDEADAAEPDHVRAGTFVALIVSDTGTGMPPHVRERLFEPYFTTKPAGQGTGLGLSTVYGIVTQFDGQITVSSEAGLGTTFRILLPPAEAEVTAAADPAAQRLPSGAEHVLLVEDDASVRRLASDLLARLGYSVTEAASGRAGLALGSDDTRHFDLLVCDVILGDMSGPSVAEALVALRPSIRVLYISGYTDDAIVRTGVLEQGKPFLPKPFTPLQLARKIREVLDDRRAGAA